MLIILLCTLSDPSLEFCCTVYALLICLLPCCLKIFVRSLRTGYRHKRASGNVSVVFKPC